MPAATAEWEAVLSLASEHLLMPAPWVELRDAGRVAPVSPEVLDVVARLTGEGRDAPELVLQRAYEANARRSQELVAAGTRALEVIEAAGMRVVAIKGLHTRLTGLWNDPAACVMADVDVLAPPGDGRAFDALRAAGWQAAPEGAGEFADHQLPPLRDDHEVRVEVHEHILRRRWDALLPSADVVRAARIVEGPEGARRVMDDTHAVITLISHAQLEDDTYRRFDLPLRTLHETDRWARARDGVIDWTQVERRFARVGEPHVLPAHLGLCAHLFGTPLPQRVSGRTACRTGVGVAGSGAPRRRAPSGAPGGTEGSDAYALTRPKERGCCSTG